MFTVPKIFHKLLSTYIWIMIQVIFWCCLLLTHACPFWCMAVKFGSRIPQRALYPQLDASSLGLWDLVKLWGMELNGRSPGHCKASSWRGSRITAPLLTSDSLVGNGMRDFPLPCVSTMMNKHEYKDKGTYWSWTGISKLSSQISLFSSRPAVSGMCCNDGKLANMCGFFLQLFSTCSPLAG